MECRCCCLFIILFIDYSYRIFGYDENDNYSIEHFTIAEHSSIRLICDLSDVAWWKRPDLIATRSGIVLPDFDSKMRLELKENSIELIIENLHSNDSGIYECETLGAIRLFNITVLVRLNNVQFGLQSLSSDSFLSNDNASLSSRRSYIHLREDQLIRLTCVVARARPAAILSFPFDLDYQLERNSSEENNDQTYRSILVFIVRLDRRHHRKHFFCQAQQNESVIRSNDLFFDVAYSPRCVSKSLQHLYAALNRPINLTCHMHHGNPSTINFTWHLPNGEILRGNHLNSSSNSLRFIPKDRYQFGVIICRGQNEYSLAGQCHLKMTLGAPPDPIQSCRYTYANTTLTVNCVPGFHQGDEEFFCYMYKRQDNGSYSEHARLKGNCAFILPDLRPDLNHEFRVFTRNKFGDSYDQSYPIQVGKPRVDSFVDKTRLYWPYLALFLFGACLLSALLVFCSCQQIRKLINKKQKSQPSKSDLTYHNHNHHHQSNGKSSSMHIKQNGHAIVHPIRPYRLKDHLISSEPSTLRRTQPKTKLDSDPLSPRRSTYKETDLDHIVATLRKSPSSSNAPAHSSIQRSTPMTNVDFSSINEPLFLFQKPLRHTYSPLLSQTRPTNSLVMENTYLTSPNSSWLNITDYDRENRTLMYDRDDGIFV